MYEFGCWAKQLFSLTYASTSKQERENIWLTSKEMKKYF
jgi:hypothetical protein